MKIIVPAKSVPDPDQKVRVRADGLGIVEEDTTYVLNPFDEVAVEEAIRLRERGPGPVEIVAVGIGPDRCEPQLRSALAMGADRAVHVACEQTLDPWNVARLLQQLVLREAPHLVLMGKQAIDEDANQTGQFLAALLAWPQATFASQIELLDGSARVARETDAGIETLRVTLPAVLTVDLRLNEPRYAALPSLLRARQKPLTRLTCAELGVAVEPRVRLLQLQAAAGSRSCQRVDSVAALVEQLRGGKAI